MSRKKTFPRPSERCECGDLHPAPPHSSTLFLEGLLVWSLWLAALSRGDANPICCSCMLARFVFGRRTLHLYSFRFAPLLTLLQQRSSHDCASQWPCAQ